MIKIFIILMIIGFIWTVCIEPYVLSYTKFNLKTDNIKGLKIVFISDLHIKPFERFRLERIVKAVNVQNPDIVLMGGDYVNSHKRNLTLPIEDIAYNLGKIKSKYGIYAVLGNHDGWQGKYSIIKALEANGIKVLENENISPVEGLTIAGVEDLQTGEPDINKAINNITNFVILLTHSPDIFPDVPQNVMLTLAGHTHGGQVVIGGAILVPSKFGKKYAYGLINENGKSMFVSRGLGSSILPVRFCCRPELVIINL